GFKRVVVDKSHYHSLTFEKGEWKAQAYDIASFSNYRQTVSDGGRTFASCSNFAYSPLASFRMGMSASASFQRVRKSLYAASARTRAASASAPCEVLACKALARATPKCANAPVQQFQTMPLWSISFWNSAAAALPFPAAKYASPRTYNGYRQEILATKLICPNSMAEAACRVVSAT